MNAVGRERYDAVERVVPAAVVLPAEMQDWILPTVNSIGYVLLPAADLH